MRTLSSTLHGAAMLLLPAAAAWGQISLELRPVAGTDDIVVRWEADPSVVGPFHLLRAGPSPGEWVLPTEVHRAGVTSPLVLSRAEETAGGDGLRVYALSTDAGACSNVAYVRVLRHRAPGGATLRPAFPWRGGLRTAAELLDDEPNLAAVAGWYPFDGWSEPRLLAARADGSRVGADFRILPGDAVLLVPTDPWEPVVITGAAEPSPRPLRFERPPVDPGLFSPRLGTTQTSFDALFCGEEGVDWFDEDGDGAIDQPHEGCLGGLMNVRPDGPRQGQLTLWQRSEHSEPSRWRVRTAGEDARWFFGDVHLDPLSLIRAEGRGWRGPEEAFDSLPDDRGALPECRCPDGDGDGVDDCSERLWGSDPDDPYSAGSDRDGDRILDVDDVCPDVPDFWQRDRDRDGVGDVCDPCPDDDPSCIDPDGDGIRVEVDSCPDTPVHHWRDDDGDLVDAACDVCPDDRDPLQADTDGDGRGDACDCAPDDPGLLLAPESGPELRVSRAELAPGAFFTGLIWEDEREPYGSATVHDVVKGPLAALAAGTPALGARCLERGLVESDTADGEDGSWWYLVRWSNACGPGPYGLAALDDADPCR